MINPDQAWIEQLAARYADVLQRQNTPEGSLQHDLNTLLLASSTLAQVQLHNQQPALCSQIAVIGPTQSGKSTLVNVLLDTEAATASPLAGFTVHSQGYAADCPDAHLSLIDELMSPLIRTPAHRLDSSDLDSYVLESVKPGRQALVSQSIVWDTPDFDSIEARSYSRAVFKTAALADVVILAMSKDKYGDKSVWDMLGLLHALSKPMIICINKLDEQDEAVINRAFTERFKKQFDTNPPPLILLPFVKRTHDEQAVSFPQNCLNNLQQALSNRLNHAQRDAQASACSNFIESNEMRWMAPLLEEMTAQKNWQALVDEQMIEADEQYQSTYLNNPDKYETFNRALAELLTLLEIPGVAATLARTRQVITWPARRLLGAGRAVLKNRSLKDPLANDETDQEAIVMDHLLNGALISLQGQLLNQAQTPWWNALNQRFREQLPHIRTAFDAESATARADFDPQIEAAAQALYNQLQSQPTLLNTLRAARVSADAAGVALAVKSGGLAPADLVLAPAMLSVTTLLTESALGKYLDAIKQKLKATQRKHINETVWQGVLASRLNALTRSLDHPDLFISDLQPELRSRLDELYSRQVDN